LHKIYIEVKAAYRHDVSGCADMTNEIVQVTETTFKFSGQCSDQIDNNILFELDFNFWADVKPETLTWER